MSILVFVISKLALILVLSFSGDQNLELTVTDYDPFSSLIFLKDSLLCLVVSS
jgi:hypothetical protein